MPKKKKNNQKKEVMKCRRCNTETGVSSQLCIDCAKDEADELACELEEHLVTIKEALGAAEDLLRQHGGRVYERAKSYWLAHIAMALDNDHSYLGGSMVKMEDTVNELRRW